MNDTELFNLCKQVYEATGWAMDKAPMFHNVAGGLAVISWEDYYSGKYTSVPPYPIPLYTSDYLLEKLPRTVKDVMHEDAYLMLYPKGKVWNADYIGMFMEAKGDTPLKALLKLTIALSEAGELK